MFKFLHIALSALFLSLTPVTSTKALADVSEWKVVGNWNIDFYSNGPGCGASTVYGAETLFLIGLLKRDDDILLGVTIIDDAWESIEAGKEYAVKVYFGDETPWTLEMTGRDFSGSPGLSFTFDSSTEQSGLFAEEFTKETSMKWFYQNVMLGHYSLRGTRAAFEEIVACQKSFNEATSGVSDPFGGSSGSSNPDPFSQ